MTGAKNHENSESCNTRHAASSMANWKEEIIFLAFFCPKNGSLQTSKLGQPQRRAPKCQLAYGKFSNIIVLSRLPHREAFVILRRRQSFCGFFGLRNVNFFCWKVRKEFGVQAILQFRTSNPFFGLWFLLRIFSANLSVLEDFGSKLSTRKEQSKLRSQSAV